MLTGSDSLLFAPALFASTLSGWFHELARGKQAHVFLYPIVIVGLLLALWFIYLVFRFLIFRPIAKSQFASNKVQLQFLMLRTPLPKRLQ